MDIDKELEDNSELEEGNENKEDAEDMTKEEEPQQFVADGEEGKAAMRKYD